MPRSTASDDTIYSFERNYTDNSFEINSRSNYSEDISPNFDDLRNIAEDDESSMIKLTSNESQCLEKAKQHYLALISNEDKISQIMKRLREDLSARYLKKPARLESANLPLDWNEFQKLDVTPEQRTLALQKYYQNTAHTALRYISKPNYWLDSDAPFVEYYQDGYFSNFESFKELISLCYLAVSDKNILPPTSSGHTLESRIDYFICELAYIGRAHNWDESQYKMDKEGNLILDENGKPITEECDDLKADNPSCSGGTTRRLFQSVQGHPMFEALTESIVKQSINEWMHNHFKTHINKYNYFLIKAAWDKTIMLDDLTEQESKAVEQLNITALQQKDLLEQMTTQWGFQFSDNLTFIALVKKELALEENQYHLFKFGQIANFFLEKSTLTFKDNEIDSSNKQELITLLNTFLQSLAEKMKTNGSLSLFKPVLLSMNTLEEAILILINALNEDTSQLVEPFIDIIKKSEAGKIIDDFILSGKLNFLAQGNPLNGLEDLLKVLDNQLTLNKVSLI